MPRNTIDFNTVRNIGLALPGVEEGTAYGQPALKVHEKHLACLAAHRSTEPNSLAPADAGAKAVAADLDSPDSVPRFEESDFPAATSAKVGHRDDRFSASGLAVS